ncbi:MAG: recombinase family protein [Syntrophobacteraceae bacterium]
MLIGYARVSREDQNLVLQLDALGKAGCAQVFQDKQGAWNGIRPGLADALRTIRAGDVLMVWKLDRLGRTVKDLIEMAGDLERRGIHFKSLTDQIDTSTSMGRFFFHVMASLARMERELLIERTQAGLVAARRRGRVGGRPAKMTKTKLDTALKLLQSGMTYDQAAEQLSISVKTLYARIPATRVPVI